MNLVLPLKSEFFFAIKSGEKIEEFRIRNDYWKKRIEGRTYENVVLTLGYPRSDDTERRIILPWRGYRICTLQHPIFGNSPVEVFAIALSDKAKDS